MKGKKEEKEEEQEKKRKKQHWPKCVGPKEINIHESNHSNWMSRNIHYYCNAKLRWAAVVIVGVHRVTKPIAMKW